MNELSINVFGLDDNENITVLHAHTFKSEKPIINLLLIEDDYNSHYVFIKNLNSLFTKNKVNNFVCPKCFQRFSTKNAIENHTTKTKCIQQTEEITKEFPKIVSILSTLNILNE